MTCLAANGDIFVVARDHLVDLYNVNSDVHSVLLLPRIPPAAAAAAPAPIVGTEAERDCVVDVALSPDGAYAAVMTGASKRLVVFELARPDSPMLINLPRAASRARFTADSSQILVADKTGDAFSYDFKDPNIAAVKLFSHFSILLDILMTDDSYYVITSDRDEKIRVSHYPNTYNIKSYCLGHKEFVRQIQLLPNDSKFLLSSSGDGTVKFWDFADGRLCHTIETKEDIVDKKCLECFVDAMDKEGIEVSALPVMHMSAMQLTHDVCLVAVNVYPFKQILIYRVTIKTQQFEHSLHCTLPLESFLCGLQFSNGKLFACYDGEQRGCVVQVYEIKPSDGALCNLKSVDMFSGEDVMQNTSRGGDIQGLYKRKFDNVQEYQDRKRQRLEKHGES